MSGRCDQGEGGGRGRALRSRAQLLAEGGVGWAAIGLRGGCWWVGGWRALSAPGLQCLPAHGCPAWPLCLPPHAAELGRQMARMHLATPQHDHVGQFGFVCDNVSAGCSSPCVAAGSLRVLQQTAGWGPCLLPFPAPVRSHLVAIVQQSPPPAIPLRADHRRHTGECSGGGWRCCPAMGLRRSRRQQRGLGRGALQASRLTSPAPSHRRSNPTPGRTTGWTFFGSSACGTSSSWRQTAG